MGKSLLFLLLGIGIGVLIAPDKGSNTLNSLFNTAEGYKDDAEDFIADTTDKVKSKAKGIKKVVDD